MIEFMQNTLTSDNFATSGAAKFDLKGFLFGWERWPLPALQLERRRLMRRSLLSGDDYYLPRLLSPAAASCFPS